MIWKAFLRGYSPLRLKTRLRVSALAKSSDSENALGYPGPTLGQCDVGDDHLAHDQ
jgi:hypothetical protein